MRHRKSGRRLGRDSSHRKALFRNMVTSLMEHERIQTTDAKAKELRGIADRMITLGKRGDLNARRQAAAVLRHGLLQLPDPGQSQILLLVPVGLPLLG